MILSMYLLCQHYLSFLFDFEKLFINWELYSWHFSGVGSVKTVWSVVKGNAKALAMLQEQLENSDIFVCLFVILGMFKNCDDFMWFVLVNVWSFLIIYAYALADAGKDQTDGLKVTQ